jgi:hypothetical protein
MKKRILLGRELCPKGPFEEETKPRMNANRRELERLWIVEEEAASSKGSASVSLAVSIILRDTSTISVGRCGPQRRRRLGHEKGWSRGGERDTVPRLKKLFFHGSAGILPARLPAVMLMAPVGP